MRKLNTFISIICAAVLTFSLIVPAFTLTVSAETWYDSEDGVWYETDEYGYYYEVDPADLESHFVRSLVQSFEEGSGTFTLSRDARIYNTARTVLWIARPPRDELEQALGLSASLMAAAGFPSASPLSIVYGKEKYSKTGDIVIKNMADLKGDFEPVEGTASDEQSYRLSIREDGITLTAGGDAGVYYGMLTLIKLFTEEEANGGSANTVPCCEISDGPSVGERVFYLDCGRKYFTKSAIKNMIRRASFRGYNAIELHFSDSDGLRLDSEVFPWLTADIESLSREDMTEIVQTAQEYQMEVIPSFDVPSHNWYIVSTYEDYVTENPDFSFEYDGTTYRALDTADAAGTSADDTDSATGDDDSGTASDSAPGDTADSAGIGAGSAYNSAGIYTGMTASEWRQTRYQNRLWNGCLTIANYYNRGGAISTSRNVGIDITSDYALAFLNALTDDYAEFFSDLGCTKFDIGGDEVMSGDGWTGADHWAEYAVYELGITEGTAADTFINFMNETAARLEKMGYTCRMFNDEIEYDESEHIELSSSIEIVYWAGGHGSAKKHAKSGHTLYHDISKWCYYVSGLQNGSDIMTYGKYSTVNAENIFNNWDPRSFSSTAGANKTVDEEYFGGAYFSVWCDSPDYKTVDTIWEETDVLSWANACKMWNPSLGITDAAIEAAEAAAWEATYGDSAATAASAELQAAEYSEFCSFAAKMGSYPGFGGAPDVLSVMPQAAAAEKAKRK